MFYSNFSQSWALTAGHSMAPLLMSSMMSWGCLPSMLQPTDWAVPRISLMVPAAEDKACQCFSTGKHLRSLPGAAWASERCACPRQGVELKELSGPFQPKGVWILTQRTSHSSQLFPHGFAGWSPRAHQRTSSPLSRSDSLDSPRNTLDTPCASPLPRHWGCLFPASTTQL